MRPFGIELVWNKHLIHARKKVKALLARHPRLDMQLFPTVAAELNPMEFVWTQISEYAASLHSIIPPSCKGTC